MITGSALIAEGHAFKELRKYPNPLPKPSAHSTVLRTKWSKTRGKRAGQVGIVMSAWESTEKGWTTGATASFAADIVAIGLTIICPVCGIVYGAARLAVDLAGYDVADMIDNSVGADYGAKALLTNLAPD